MELQVKLVFSNILKILYDVLLPKFMNLILYINYVLSLGVQTIANQD